MGVKHTLEVEVCKTDYYQRMCCQRLTPEMTFVQHAQAKYGLCPSSYASSTSSSSSSHTPSVFGLLGWTFDDILNIMSNKDPATTPTIDAIRSSSSSTSSSSSSIVSNSIYSYITSCESTEYLYMMLYMLLIASFIVGCFRLRVCNCYIVPV